MTMADRGEDFDEVAERFEIPAKAERCYAKLSTRPSTVWTTDGNVIK